MNIRKEPTLLAVVVLIGAYGFYNAGSVIRKRTARPSQIKEYEAAPDTAVVLAAPMDTIVSSSRDMFREPTESDPLPPVELPFPALPEFPVVLPPLSPGQEAGAYYGLRIAGGKKVDHQFQPVADTGEVPVGTGQDNAVQAMSRPYDIVYKAKGNQKLLARILNKDRYELALEGVAAAVIRYDWLGADGHVIRAGEETKPGEVTKIELAETTENWVELSKRELPMGASAVKRRQDFIRELLIRAQNASWVYKEAEAQAKILVLSTAGDIAGYRWSLRVLRAQGDLERQWQFLDALPSGKVYASFQHRARGQLLAVLGLWVQAEAELRKAVDLQPRNPRSNSALAHFLLDRGRVEDAEASAKLAHSLVGRIATIEDRFDVASAYVAVKLALGQINEARTALGALPGQDTGRKAYWTGAVEYADRKFEEAKSLFASAAAEGVAKAQLGLGICEMMAEDWDQAHTLLLAVEKTSPLLRHRALAALAILYERTGHSDKALASIEKAVLIDPSDPYVLYMLGRQRRIAKQYVESFAALRQALALRDDLIEGNAEAALGLYEHSLEEADQADFSVGAARFGDRLVRMDASRGDLTAFIEFQGYMHFRLGDMSDARAAFQAGAARSSSFCEIGVALIDYKQNRIAEAREQLVAIADERDNSKDVRNFAKDLVDRVDAQLSLEQIRDSFDRDELGDLWETTSQSGSASLRIEGEGAARALHAVGTPNRSGSVFARRVVKHGGDFVSVEVDVQAGAKHNAFAGVKLTHGQRDEFRLVYGLRPKNGQLIPYLLIEDGDKESPDPIDLRSLVDLNPTGVQQLEVAVAKTGSSGQNLSLRVSWNGVVVHRRETLKKLRPNAKNRPLNVDLIATNGSEFDVFFESFRLVRRKEN